MHSFPLIRTRRVLRAGEREKSPQGSWVRPKQDQKQPGKAFNLHEDNHLFPLDVHEYAPTDRRFLLFKTLILQTIKGQPQTG